MYLCNRSHSRGGGRGSLGFYQLPDPRQLWMVTKVCPISVGNQEVKQATPKACPLAGATSTATSDSFNSTLWPPSKSGVLMPPALFLYHRRSLVFWQECFNTPQENCSLVYSAVPNHESHKVPMPISSSAVAGPWLLLTGSRSAGPSSAFGFANSCAMVFLVCGGSVVGHLGLLSGVSEAGSKAVFHVVVTFAGDRVKNKQLSAMWL